MSQEPTASERANTWLLSRLGPLAGTRFLMPDGTTRIGRAPDNDVVVDDADSNTVSLHHVEICRGTGSCSVRDLGSTNGTWIHGERITEAEVSPPAIIQLGRSGPEFALVLADAAPAGLDRTIETSASAMTPIPAGAVLPITAHEKLLSAAVNYARRMRARGVGGQTMTIMRSVIVQTLRQTHHRFRIIRYSLLAALLAVSSVAIWRITSLEREKRAIDAHIQRLEAELQASGGGKNIDPLLAQLSDYQNQAEALRQDVLFRLSGGYEGGDFVTRQLHSVMAEFGAEVYSIPPEFIERVNHYIQQDQGADRPLITRALNQAGGQLETMRRILQEQKLPADLAYIPLVESALAAGQPSAAGAVGPWQFTVTTARAFGLRVDGRVDERKDLVPSTLAACKYLRDLILDFGAGSSVMLALAAYNSGTAKVKEAVSRTVRDPIKQRNFWYLYRVRALPLETREYVPKVFAAILIGRDPRHFGF
ncbi:MAG: transglycosylase SLT domain-containing protein [Bryobacteraceae bacterium]|jgi:pSer/pThr/pTyr-binding forkhead associated (FHA) protein